MNEKLTVPFWAYTLVVTAVGLACFAIGRVS